MAKTIGARADKEHREALERLVEHGDADSQSEALRQTSQAELARRGYLNGTQLDTPLRQTFREFSRLFVYGGFAWLGISVLWAVQIRLGGVFMLAIGLLMYAIDQSLGTVEPAVTDRLTGLLTRDAT